MIQSATVFPLAEPGVMMSKWFAFGGTSSSTLSPLAFAAAA